MKPLVQTATTIISIGFFKLKRHIDVHHFISSLQNHCRSMLMALTGPLKSTTFKKKKKKSSAKRKKGGKMTSFSFKKKWMQACVKRSWSVRALNAGPQPKLQISSLNWSSPQPPSGLPACRSAGALIPIKGIYV